MGCKIVGWIATIAALSAAQVMAHHAVSTVYDEGRTVTIQGTVGSVVTARPHAVLHLVVDSQEGRTRTWAIELDDAGPVSTGSVPSTGVAAQHRSTLAPGDQITVCGNPGRDPGAYRVRMLKLQRSDGWLLRSDAGLAIEQCVS